MTTTHVLSNNIREQFKNAMIQQAIDERDLAAAILEKPQVVSRILAGKQDLRLSDMVRISEALGLTIYVECVATT